MKVEVRLFARARDLAGSDRVELDLPDGASVSTLRAALCEQYASMADLVPHLHVAIGQDYAGDEDVVPSDVEIACFPPVSGG